MSWTKWNVSGVSYNFCCPQLNLDYRFPPAPTTKYCWYSIESFVFFISVLCVWNYRSICKLLSVFFLESMPIKFSQSANNILSILTTSYHTFDVTYCFSLNRIYGALKSVVMYTSIYYLKYFRFVQVIIYRFMYMRMKIRQEENYA